MNGCIRWIYCKSSPFIGYFIY